MIGKLKMFAFGFVLGVLLAFPLGMNFGQGERLLSNPLKKIDVQEEVTATVKTAPGRRNQLMNRSGWDRINGRGDWI